MTPLVVIAANGPDRYVECVESWRNKTSLRPLLLDTGSGEVASADENVGPVWQTGAFIHAYRETNVSAFLFTQDTVTVLPEADDPIEWFRRRMPADGIGAVGWQLFSMDEYRAYAEGWYWDVIRHRPGWTPPAHGIVGPVFYTTRRTLDMLAAQELLPYTPLTRAQASGSERAWAYAFALAGVPLVGEPFTPHEVPARVTEHYPLKKVWLH